MLTPGLKDFTGQQRSFSPVLDGLGSQRYSQIIQNMRFLGAQRPGSLKPESINLIGRDLPAKFANIADLLHIKAPSAPDSSIWSQVDQTLPAGGQASSPVAQTPDEPGTMRQGTVISRLPTVPKTAQGFESIKQQIQSRASSAKPAAPVRKTPRPGDPSVRRFARIEEISNKEAPAASEPPAATPPAIPPATVQRQPEPMPDVLKADAPNQPAPDPEPVELPKSPKVRPPAQPDSVFELSQPRAARAPERPAPVSEPAKVPEARVPGRPAPVIEPPKAPAPRISEQPTPVPEPPKAPAPRAPEQPVPVSKPPKALEAGTPAQDTPISTPVARPEAPLPRAVPTPKKQGQAPALALPKARPTPAPQAGKLTQTPTPRARTEQKLKISAPAPSAVIQRQVDKPSIAEKPDSLESPGLSFLKSSETRQESSIASIPDAPVESAAAELPNQDMPAPVAQPAPRQTEAPLVTQLSRRRAVSGQVRFLEPKIVKPEADRPALIRPDLRQPKRQTRASTPQAPEPAQPTVLARARQVATQLPARPSEQPVPQPDLASFAAPAPQAPVEMPVARRMESAASYPVKSAVVEQAVVSHQLPKNQVQPEARPTPTVAAASSNVVQRLWEEHSDSGSGSGGGSGAPAQGGSGGGDALDLDKIAEQVLPIVKRLIEIESERSSGYLR
ncbi:MAG: hypothetical protein CVU44_08175 [Chloroflexi bacterium HGW-Chloroflexi-6]|nr:MAG: hypothetical protein CVU44_08175 [Chloroflexi bacterium HGW-Chloroflexi-6]